MHRVCKMAVSSNGSDSAASTAALPLTEHEVVILPLLFDKLRSPQPAEIGVRGRLPSTLRVVKEGQQRETASNRNLLDRHKECESSLRVSFAFRLESFSVRLAGRS